MADTVVYAPVLKMATPYTATGFDAEDGTEAVANATGRINFNEGSSEMVAVDAATGEIIWVREFDEPTFSAATVINDLVFMATFNGILYAMDREDGEIVWEYNLQGGVNAWFAVAGDMLLVPVGVGSRPVLVAFRLGEPGQIPTPQPWLTPVPTPALGPDDRDEIDETSVDQAPAGTLDDVDDATPPDEEGEEQP
jgi:hypothetical protein